MKNAVPLPQAKPPVEAADIMTPKVPTAVVGSFKGGVLKTALAVGLAERLAMAGLTVVLLACDGQEDARHRLGLSPTDPNVARVTRGDGTILVAGMPTGTATKMLYEIGFGKLGHIDVVIVDTPPVRHGGSLPGVLLIAPTDGDDATRNLCSMLRLTPKNTEIVLVRVHTKNSRPDRDEWAREVDAISVAAGRDDLKYISNPIPRADPVKDALDAGQSVWDLPRRGRTLEFLTELDTLAGVIWSKVRPKTPMPAKQRKAPGYVAGWSDDD